MKIMENILITPEQLEEIRKKAGFRSQAKAADFLNVDHRTYRRWRLGEVKIPYMAYLCLKLYAEIAALKSGTF